MAKFVEFQVSETDWHCINLSHVTQIVYNEKNKAVEVFLLNGNSFCLSDELAIDLYDELGIKGSRIADNR